MTQLISSRLSQNITTRAYPSQKTFLRAVTHSPIWANRYQAVAHASRSFSSSTFPPDTPMKRMVRFNHSSGETNQGEENSKQSNMRPWFVALGIATVATTLAWQFNKEEAKLNRAGNNFFEAGQYSEALECYQKALKIREKDLSPDDPYLAVNLIRVGLSLTTLHKDTEALEYFQKALKIQEKVLPANDLDLAGTYYCVGETLAIIGGYAEGLEYAQKSLKIREQVLSPYHRLLAESYCTMALHVKHLGQHKEAEEYTLKALMIMENRYFFKNLNLAILHSKMGENLFYLRRYGEALQQNEKALEVIAPRENHPSHTLFLKSFITCLHFQPKNSQWESSKQKILTLYIPILGENHPLIKALQKAAPKWPLYLI